MAMQKNSTADAACVGPVGASEVADVANAAAAIPMMIRLRMCSPSSAHARRRRQ
jgi:hypothetical protein